MRVKLAAAVLCTAGIAAPAFAGDVNDVKATIDKAQKAYNSCDVETMKSLTSEKFFGFNQDGTLREGNSMEGMKAQCDAGTKFDLPLKVAKVYMGDDWAVAAGNYQGTVTPAKGEAQTIKAHFTVVLVKEDGVWKSIHFHDSPDMQQPGTD